MFPAGYWLLLGNKYVELIDQYDAAVNVWLGFQEWVDLHESPTFVLMWD